MLNNSVKSYSDLKNSNRFSTDIRDPKSIQFHKNINHWLSNPCGSFFELTKSVSTSKYTFNISPQTVISSKVNDPIYLIQQYYIPTDKTRREEIKKCFLVNGISSFRKEEINLNFFVPTYGSPGNGFSFTDSDRIFKTLKSSLNSKQKMQIKAKYILMEFFLFT